MQLCRPLVEHMIPMWRAHFEQNDLQGRMRLEEEAQRELETRSDAVEAEAARIEEPGPKKDRFA